ncbi:hypothetical protein KUV57_24880 [Epibacterium sp. DP7N7-1]|nr:hypothetical protein [Epibacterium sp. DP7N7-1]
MTTFVNYLGSSVGASLIVAAGAVCIGALPTMAQSSFEAQFDGISKRLKSVWDEEVVAAARMAYPEIDVNLMRQVSFEIPDDACDINVSIDPNAKRFVVPISHNYYIFTLMYAQTSLAYLKFGSDFSSADETVSQTRQAMNPQMSTYYELCNGERGEGLQVRAPMMEILGSPEAYLDLQEEMNSLPGIRGDADEIAGLPIFFVTLHEYGHVHLGHVSAIPSPEEEFEADMFAANVLARAELPIVFGTYGLILYDSISLRRDRRELNCRLQELARMSREERPVQSEFWVAGEERRRLERLTAALETSFETECTQR